MGLLGQEVLEEEEAQHFSDKGADARDGESDPEAPDQADDEEDDLVSAEGREREDDEDQDGVDVRHGEVDNVVLVRFKLFDDRVAVVRDETDRDATEDRHDPPHCDIGGRRRG